MILHPVWFACLHTAFSYGGFKLLLKKILVCIAFIALSVAACFAAKEFGYTQGVADTNTKHQAADIAALNQSITNLNEATKSAGEANLKLHNTISARQKADAESTKVFSNALTATAHLRFDCFFDDNIMQQLYQAADRADNAATSGLGYRMPTSAAPDR